MVLSFSESRPGISKSPQKQIQKSKKLYSETMKTIEKDIALKTKLEERGPEDVAARYTLKLFKWKIPFMFNKAYNLALAIKEIEGGKPLGTELLQEVETKRKQFEREQRFKKILSLFEQQPVKQTAPQKSRDIVKEAREYEQQFIKKHPDWTFEYHKDPTFHRKEEQEEMKARRARFHSEGGG